MKTLMLRMEDDTHAKVVDLARMKNRSLNNMVNYILDSYFEADALRVRVTEIEQQERRE